MPAGRWGTGDDVGAVAQFLATDEASYVNGSVHTSICSPFTLYLPTFTAQVINVDGGLDAAKVNN